MWRALAWVVCGGAVLTIGCDADQEPDDDTASESSSRRKKKRKKKAPKPTGSAQATTTAAERKVPSKVVATLQIDETGKVKSTKVNSEAKSIEPCVQRAMQDSRWRAAPPGYTVTVTMDTESVAKGVRKKTPANPTDPLGIPSDDPVGFKVTADNHADKGKLAIHAHLDFLGSAAQSTIDEDLSACLRKL